MSDVRIVYGFCQNNCKYEVFTKEDVIGLLQYVLENNALPSDLIIDGEINSATSLSAVNSIVDQNTGDPLKLWVGTQAQWDSYQYKDNTFAIISDDKTLESIMSKLGALESASSSLDNRITQLLNGEIVLSNVTNATTVNGIEFTQDESGVLKAGEEIICKQKLLWSGSVNVSSTSLVQVFSSAETLINKKLKILFSWYYDNRDHYLEVCFLMPTAMANEAYRYIHSETIPTVSDGVLTGFKYHNLAVNYNNSTKYFGAIARTSTSLLNTKIATTTACDYPVRIKEVYEIID